MIYATCAIACAIIWHGVYLSEEGSPFWKGFWEAAAGTAIVVLITLALVSTYV